MARLINKYIGLFYVWRLADTPSIKMKLTSLKTILWKVLISFALPPRDCNITATISNDGSLLTASLKPDFLSKVLHKSAEAHSSKVANFWKIFLAEVKVFCRQGWPEVPPDVTPADGGGKSKSIGVLNCPGFSGSCQPQLRSHIMGESLPLHGALLPSP